MKRITNLLIAALLVVALAALTGCGAKKASSGETQSAKKTVLKVGASPTPHAEILAQVKDDLAKQGIDLQVVEYTDYVLPNTNLDSGELDANYFQHQPYLDDFNKQNGTKIVSVAPIHFEPLGIYAGKTASLEALASGAKVAVPNDTTNEARALLLLESNGLLKLKANAGLKATVKDIAENPKGLKFVELEAASIPAALKDVDVAVVNGNYAISAGLSVSDALATEAPDSLAATTFANIVAVKAGNESKPAVKALVAALQSEKVKKFIEAKYKGAVVPVF